MHSTLTAMITDYVHQDLVHGLRKSGYHVIYAPDMPLTLVKTILPVVDCLVVNTRTPVDSEMMRSAKRLKCIGRLGIGLDIFDADTAQELGISIVNTPGANANAVAEHCFGMLLALMRNIPVADREVRSGSWRREPNRGRELAGLTIGIIGFGNTGRAFASKFAGWQTRILSYDKYKERYADDLRFVEECSLEQVLTQSDILSLHVPLTDETEQMVNAQFLGQCKSNLILINSSRGRVVQLEAVLPALHSGQLIGVCLDVLENEAPGSYSDREKELYGRLFNKKNVVLTPHIAGWTHQSKRNIAQQLLVSIRKLRMHDLREN